MGNCGAGGLSIYRIYYIFVSQHRPKDGAIQVLRQNLRCVKSRERIALRGARVGSCSSLMPRTDLSVPDFRNEQVEI